MSDVSQGPGWWQASDGKWYPPEQFPGATTTPVEPGPPPGPGPVPGPAPKIGGPPPPKSSNKGCMIALIVVLVLFLGAGVAAVVGLGLLGSKIEEAAESGDLFGKDSCDFITTGDIEGVLGGKYSIIQLGGLTEIATPALDARVLPDGKTCWASPESTSANKPGRTVRLARLQTSDAEARYEQELTQAKGVKQDRGGGLTVESQSYLNKEVNAGDEAFCTTGDFTGSSGVLVRRGDTLIYVSMFGDLGADDTPDISLDTDDGTIKFGSDDEHCELAQKIAAKVK